MKEFTGILIMTCLLVSAMASATVDITEKELEDIKTFKKIWIVYGTTDLSDANSQVLHDVSEILSGFFKIGIISNNDHGLKLYGDDGSEVAYTGKFSVDDIVNFVLTNTNAIIQSRSKAANDVKANKQFKEKETVRANKEWKDEQELRKKSNTLILDDKTWESGFLSQREPYLINFYEANCSACIQLNQEWEAVSTALKGKVRVAKVNMTESVSLEEQVKISKYPSIRFYPGGTKKVDSFADFDGVKKKFSILEWTNNKLSLQESVIEIAELNKQNYKTLCKDSKSTCIIAFVQDPTTIEAEMSQLASKYMKKPISFLISKAGSQPEFQKQVGVESFPETVMMYSKGNKMLKVGGMDFTAIDDIINEITLGNRNNFVKYKFEEKLN